MRISDWSSDVCSSDLGVAVRAAVPEELGNLDARLVGRYLHFADFLVLLALFKLCRRVRRRTCESGQRQGSGDQAVKCIAHEHSRSEEHTSELQSLMRISYAVFCLKKKIHIKYR